MPSQSLSAPSLWAILCVEFIYYVKGKLLFQKVRSYDIYLKRKLQKTEFYEFCSPRLPTAGYDEIHYDQTSDQGPIQHLHLLEGFNIT